MDCMNLKGRSDLIDAMKQPEAPLHYRDAVRWYCENVRSESALDALFAQTQTEIDAFLSPCDERQVSKAFAVGMLTRLLLSILVDADRWDSACFEYGDSFDAESARPDWKRLLTAFEMYRKTELHADSEIDRIRADISDQCFSRAADKPGIYTLCVPTGGGKTYSSLRYALRHAALHDRSRIFYIIPYNTILDQNAEDIRKALGDPPRMLEHHSDIVRPTKEEQEEHQKLTERWDSDIVLTSLVQFLNACFSASNTDARRLHRLTNAVLIFDEIQSLPKHCKTLFEQAISFLSAHCGSTIVLCTATQPQLALKPEPSELTRDCEALFRKMKRVAYVPQVQEPLTNEAAATKLALLAENTSVLTIVNTKSAARDVFRRTVNELEAAGMHVVTPDAAYDDAQIARSAREHKDGDILCIHLSTLLCPVHRKKWIRWIKIWLRERARVFCISTALIEAGINISFPVVVRSLAGLPSVVQAAGRANRSMEYGIGTVYLWDFCEEELSQLPDIQNGGVLTRTILADVSTDELDMPSKIASYFSMMKIQADEYKDCPWDMRHKKPSRNGIKLYDLLAENGKCARCAGNFKGTEGLRFYQSFRTAYSAFQVIPQETKAVIVPFREEGQRLIDALSSEDDMRERLFLLRKAQAYSVALYDGQMKRLMERGAVWEIGDTGVWVLEPEAYDENDGVQVETEK